ncbi:MAG TPA: family 43 glycosylhydrolase [Herpetosiphonaceae bacterium]|jgi:arabinan endo-1,5-alpha-L-arabinosidase|nr:family 43 glycosylhydrolase [Herpetosiphonaceae bacterium]
MSVLPSLTYTNPVLNEDFADPTVLLSDGVYHAYATQTVTADGPINLQHSTSSNLVEWTKPGEALPVKPEWAQRMQQFWAPFVYHHVPSNKYLMYYSAQPDPDAVPDGYGPGHALAVATSNKPEGPFVDSGAPILWALPISQARSDFENIDPFVCNDPLTGMLRIYFGSGFQPIKTCLLTDDGLRLSTQDCLTPVLHPNTGTPYENLFEAPLLLQRGAGFLLLCSGDDCCGPTLKYGVMAARGRSPIGPFTLMAEDTQQPDSVFLRGNDRFGVPGHACVRDDANNIDWLIYHAVDSRQPKLVHSTGGHDVRRVMCLDRLFYHDDGWPYVTNGSPSIGVNPSPALPAQRAVGGESP